MEMTPSLVSQAAGSLVHCIWPRSICPPLPSASATLSVNSASDAFCDGFPQATASRQTPRRMDLVMLVIWLIVTVIRLIETNILILRHIIKTGIPYAQFWGDIFERHGLEVSLKVCSFAGNKIVIWTITNISTSRSPRKAGGTSTGRQQRGCRM